MGSQIYGFITIVFILLCLWFLAFVMTKFIGNKTKSAMRSKYMRVVDTMAMGFDKTLYFSPSLIFYLCQLLELV